MIKSLVGTVGYDHTSKKYYIGINGNIILDLETSNDFDILKLIKVDSGRNVVYTHLHFSEISGFLLYGFDTPHSKCFFLDLITVPRIGHKLALKIIAQIDFFSFMSLVIKSDVKGLCKIKGIGKAGAKKIIEKLSYQ